MRKVILSMMVSLDGRTARADGDLNWFLTDEEFETEMLGVLRSVDAMLFGRVSYQLLAAYWPGAANGPAPDAAGGFTSLERQLQFAELMNAIPKVVYSRTLTRADWGPARIAGDVAQDVAAIKRQPGRDVVLFAGARIASTFMDLDLVDEYLLMVHPIVLGRGIPLFKDMAGERPLKLRRSRTFPSGIVLIQHDRAR